MSAHSRVRAPAAPSSATLPDGAMVVTPEQLARFGGGDAKRGRRELRLMLAQEREREIATGPTDRPPTVALATPADEAAILALLRIDVAENAAHIAAPDDERMLALIRTATQRKGGFAGVIREGGAIVAVTILVPAQWWWSRQWMYEDVVTFVHPRHRASRHVDDLIDFQKWVSDRMSAEFGYRTFVVSAVVATRRAWAKIALWRRKFQQSGIFCVYPAPGAPDEGGV